MIPSPPPPFLASGRFRVGCNYWASHAGAHMWSNWRPDVVAGDFAQLAEGHLTLLRVFPLWPDFQPLHRLNTQDGAFVEYRFGDDSPLPDDPVGQAGMDAIMLDRFRAMADEAHRHGLQLIVGLVTGWMSGRLFTPPAFTNVNVITDPEAIRWQGRFVRCFVEALRDHPAIVAWDLGNECNCMGRAATPAESWVWTHAIATAARAADPTRPIVSGMHSIVADPRQPWAMREQGELTDFLTTHPYPIWTPHCDQDPANSLRVQLHGTAESLFYSGIGGKPCFAEEMGSMGPFILADELTPQFLRPALFSLWAQDCRAMLWWCAYDQLLLQRPPYDWVPVEQELGLHRSDRSPKPLVGTIREFSQLLAGLPFAELPPRITEGVCVLTPRQEHWGVAQSAFMLAKLAGADLRYQWCEDPLLPADVYLLPSMAGPSPIPRRRWLELLARVEAGATLYVSLDTVVWAGLETVFGVEVINRNRRAEPGEFAGADGVSLRLPLAAGDFRLSVRATRAEVIAAEADGNPVFTRVPHGNGQVFLLTVPLERAVTSVPGAFQEGAFARAWEVYARVFADALSGRAWRKTTPEVGVTEHPVDERTRLVVLVNHRAEPVVEPVRLAPGWRLAAVLHGRATDGNTAIALPATDGAILRLERD